MFVSSEISSNSSLYSDYLYIKDDQLVANLFGNKISVEDLISLIPDDKIRKLSRATDVDHQVKKLHGRSMFYLLLYGILDSTRVSLRNLEDIYNSSKFRFLFQIDSPENTKYNSISDRLLNMNAEYFKDIYEDIYNRFSELYNEEDALLHSISRVDSTMVAEVSDKPLLARIYYPGLFIFLIPYRLAQTCFSVFFLIQYINLPKTYLTF